MNEQLLLLEDANQRLRLLPRLGAAVASWDWKTARGDVPLFRRWDEKSDDRYTFACFPLLPWSNRITQGGFAHQGAHYPIRPNRVGEPYPIHGDAWLQAWQVEHCDRELAVLSLHSRRHLDNPWEYDAEQRFALHPDGMTISLIVTHRGSRPLPYGLGLHPYFPCDRSTLLQATAGGTWLSGSDPIPIAHTTTLPPGWDFNRPARVAEGGAVDNCFSGWDGVMRIEWPQHTLALTMQAENHNGYSLLYRPPDPQFFCFEPISHPIDAFHMKARPGLAVLGNGQSARMDVNFRIGPGAPENAQTQSTRSE